ncbi:MAG TPA: aldolase/citrate lyase family protein [Pseudonocardiaceae bacterium]|jgi:4-hydroxy-2-oxoheptanedioate aldolase|nr:aldolase/citrate lyase family protein [Pseudonocardiaceae bacterium]
MTRPSLVERLAGPDNLLGTFNLIPSPEVIELIALAGFDLVIVDMEHGPHQLGQVHAAVLAADAHGLATVVRVRSLDPPAIGAVLDLGASGVLVPHVESAADAAAVVRSARFAPEGERGANPWVRAGGFGARQNWFADTRRDVAVLVMIEGKNALADLPRILAVPGLDAVFLGPVDLSHALGVPGRIDHPTVLAALERAVDLAAARQLTAGVFAPEPAAAPGWWRQGVRLVACGVDTGLIRSALCGAVAVAHGRDQR